MTLLSSNTLHIELLDLQGKLATPVRVVLDLTEQASGDTRIGRISVKPSIGRRRRDEDDIPARHKYRWGQVGYSDEQGEAERASHSPKPDEHGDASPCKVSVLSVRDHGSDSVPTKIAVSNSDEVDPAPVSSWVLLPQSFSCHLYLSSGHGRLLQGQSYTVPMNPVIFGPLIGIVSGLLVCLMGFLALPFLLRRRGLMSPGNPEEEEVLLEES